MNLYLLIRQTHILSMMLSLVLAIAAEPVLLSAARLGRVEQLEQRYRLGMQLLKVSDLTRFLGFLAGIALVFIGGWSPLAPWLVSAYGLFALMDVVGRVGMRPWQRQLTAMLQLQGGAAVADLRDQIVDRRAVAARWAIIVLLLTIMSLMRQKPSFGL